MHPDPLLPRASDLPLPAGGLARGDAAVALRRPLRILLVDDHTLFRESLALLLQHADSRTQVVEAGGCEQALQWLAQHGAADLALVDLVLPGMSGMSGLERLREHWPAMPAVAISADDSPATVTAALDRGAAGFIAKSGTANDMLTALRVVLARGVHVPALPAPAVGGQLGPPPPPPEVCRDPSGNATLQALGITPRQGDVLRLLLQGKSAKLICKELALSEGTVKTHTSAVLRALHVTTRTQAVIVASRLGLRF